VRLGSASRIRLSLRGWMRVCSHLFTLASHLPSPPALPTPFWSSCWSSCCALRPLTRNFILAEPSTQPSHKPHRYTSFTQAQQAGLSQVAYEVEDLMGFIQRQHDTAMGAMHGQAAAAPPPMSAAAAPGAAGSPSHAPMGGFSGGKPAAAAAPGALLGGGADGAPLAPTGGCSYCCCCCCCCGDSREAAAVCAGLESPALQCKHALHQAGCVETSPLTVFVCVVLCCSGGRPNYGASLGPIQPPAAAGAPKAAAPKAAPAGKGWVTILCCSRPCTCPLGFVTCGPLCEQRSCAESRWQAR
jgi:hypothetical protein